MASTSGSHIPGRAASRMLPIDAFFWRAEVAMPQLRPLVAGLFMLDRAPDRRRFRASMRRLIALFPRLRQRVIDASLPLQQPRWQEDADFDLGYHVREIALPGPGNQRQLFDFSSALFASPLDHLRPLWEAYLIEGVEDGRAALFLKLHHSVMDGVGAVALFDALTQLRRNHRVLVPRERKGDHDGSVTARASDWLWDAADGIRTAIQTGSRMVRNPLTTIDDMSRTTRAIRKTLEDFGPPTPPDPLAARCTGIGRRLDGLTLSLSRLRRIKSKLGCTLNDLVLDIVAGAVGRYHEEHDIRMRRVQCIVPMSVREDHERKALGNRVAAFGVKLPVGVRDPLIRLEMIRGQTGAAKGNGGGVASQLLMNAVGLLPGGLFRAFAQYTNGRVHLICSNVPGPTVQTYLAGAKVETVYPFAPIMLGIPLALALVSYGDTCAVGIATDPAAIPDPERLRGHIEAELEEIERRVLPHAEPAQPSVVTRPDARPTLRLAVDKGKPVENRPNGGVRGKEEVVGSAQR